MWKGCFRAQMRAPIRACLLSGGQTPTALSQPVLLYIFVPMGCRCALLVHLIRVLIDQNPLVHSLRPIDVMRQGWLSSLRQVSQQWVEKRVSSWPALARGVQSPSAVIVFISMAGPTVRVMRSCIPAIRRLTSTACGSIARRLENARRRCHILYAKSPGAATVVRQSRALHLPSKRSAHVSLGYCAVSSAIF